MDAIRWLDPEDPAIGGKARSLARLRGLGLPVPAGFAIASSLGRGLVEAGPPPPRALRCAADLDALETARAALAARALPLSVARELASALDALDPAADPAARFAVRSSAPEEDSATGASPGIFESVVNVPRDAIAGAITRVLASSLAPAAFSTRGAGAERALGVLVHRFVGGTAHGAAAARSAPDGALADLRIDTQAGALTDGARAQIERALATVVRRFGPSEIEWTARGDEVTYLQLRPWHPGPPPRPGMDRDDQRVDRAAPDGWTWDAAHNPEPLSPAQAGLVALVDERAATGLRQRVIDGYLCFRPRGKGDGDARAPAPPGTAADSPRALLDGLSSDVEAALASLGPAPPLAAALEVYVQAYERLFGVVQPACDTARSELVRALEGYEPDPASVARSLTEGVPSAATRRAQLARALATADAPARQAALEAYLAAFGDESARWDVASPTLRETPERLLLLSASPAPEPAAPGAGASPEARARAVAARLPAAARPAFDAARARAREAAAAAEDDDALFARLQALVRRSLLALGKRLASVHQLAAPEDVFFLPLELARALDAPPAAEDRAGTTGAGPATDLPAQVTAARRAWSAAAAAPPWSRAPGDGAGAGGPSTPRPPLVRGQSGSPGRAIGHVVHHPSAAPTRLDHAAVLVAATLLPTELPLVAPAAIVVETGTILGHVSAQARERGIPAVVGAPGARDALPEGTLVLVDGDRGEVLRLDEPPPR